MSLFRREFLKLMTHGVTGAVATSAVTPGAYGQAAPMPDASPWFVYDVKHHDAKGDGVTIDIPAINRAIEAANKAGGGTVRIPAGTYACYSIHLKSNVALYLDHPGCERPGMERKIFVNSRSFGFTQLWT